MSAPTSLLKRRGVVISVSAVVIIAVGAFTGAMLKTDQEKIVEVRKVQTESFDDRIDR
jgi:flagellar motor component MotA